MTVKRGKYPKGKLHLQLFALAERVKSKQIGSCFEFPGIVTGVYLADRGNVFYIVLDDSGVPWHRDANDLTSLEEELDEQRVSETEGSQPSAA